MCEINFIVLIFFQYKFSNFGRFCCTQYYENPVPVKRLKFYKIQKDTDYCNIKAVIFKPMKGKPFCANPDSPWVQKAMESVIHCIKDKLKVNRKRLSVFLTVQAG
uniref:Chemokine interleukin-8-like domain-containing protein n=1 Tax=Mola mola TaxID=94237 RepID=A0A3Q3X0C6_MOLML